jgi:hypothetical protein
MEVLHLNTETLHHNAFEETTKPLVLVHTITMVNLLHCNSHMQVKAADLHQQQQSSSVLQPDQSSHII